jgi:hypothetical protein
LVQLLLQGDIALIHLRRYTGERYTVLYHYVGPHLVSMIGAGKKSAGQ